MSKASDDVLSERQRQIDAEDWTEEHDDQHTDGSLALAAACYARPLDKQRTEVRGEDYDGSGGRGDCPVWRTEHYAVPKLWPKSWAPSWWKPKNRRRDLVRAAALLIAEIERLDRAASKTANALGEGRERGILREASSGEAATSTDGLGGWCSGVRALVCMHCHRRDMPTDGPALLPKPRITQDGDCAQHLDPPESDPFWGKNGLGTALSDLAVF